MTNLILIGTGNIGKRHLQAIGNLTIDYHIYCYDIQASSLKSIPGFLKVNNVTIKNISYMAEFNDLIKYIPGSITIIASTAANRKELLIAIIKNEPLAIYAEKPLCQDLETYEFIMEVSSRNKIPVYLNFIAHMQPFYQKINKELNAGEEYTFYSNLPHWGISTVGIHQFELFTWLFQVKEYKMVSAAMKSVYEQKRKGFYDIAGNIVLLTNENNICVVNNTQNDSFASIQLITNSKVYTIFEQERKMIIIDRSSGLQVENLNYVHVSQYSDTVIKNILAHDMHQSLPNINQSYLAHKILFEYLDMIGESHLNVT